MPKSNRDVSKVETRQTNELLAQLLEAQRETNALLVELLATTEPVEEAHIATDKEPVATTAKATVKK